MLPPLSDWWSHGTRMSISLLSVLVGPKLLFTNHDWVIALFIHWSGRSTCPGWMESGEPAWRFAFWHHATTKQLSWVQPFRRRCGGPGPAWSSPHTPLSRPYCSMDRGGVHWLGLCAAVPCFLLQVQEWIAGKASRSWSFRPAGARLPSSKTSIGRREVELQQAARRAIPCSVKLYADAHWCDGKGCNSRTRMAASQQNRHSIPLIDLARLGVNRITQ
jgi:hypothetical protein